MSEHSAVTQRVGLTRARLALSRLRPRGSLSQVLKQACSISSHALGVGRVGVWLFEKDADALRCICLHDTRGEMTLPVLKMSAMPHYCDAVLQRRFVASDDVMADEATRELTGYFSEHGIVALLDAAIYRDGQVVGIVCHERTETSRPFSNEERQFAATVADVVAYLLELDLRLDWERRAHELELEMKDSQRIEAIARFASGIAHDMGNLLAVVSSGLELLERDPTSKEVRAMIRESTEQGVSLTRQLTSFAKGTASQQRPVTAADLQPHWEVLFGSVLMSPLKVAFDVDPSLTVWADRVQLDQVVTNLVFNARDAMPDGGTILVRLKRIDDEWLRLEVVDTGCGIPSENLDLLFTPFFTTKKPSRGSGLGLPTVQFLVHLHGGRVEVNSSVGDGSTFSVRWPAKQPTPVADEG